MAAARLDALERSEVDADAIRIRALTTEYYMLRIHLVSHVCPQTASVIDSQF